MKKSFDIIIADDHPLFRMGLQAILKETTYEIVGETENGLEACRLTKKLKPHFVVLDVDMPEMNGIEAAKEIRKISPQTAIVFLTGHAQISTFALAWEIGAEGFLFKENAMDEIKICLESIESGERYVSSVCKEFVEMHKDRLQEIFSFHEKVKALSKTELNILKLISQGLLSKEIADKLNNSYKTVENHRSNIVKKLELSSAANNLLSYATSHKDLIERL
jgi:NarL family two-component system response regulator LiaR